MHGSFPSSSHGSFPIAELPAALMHSSSHAWQNRQQRVQQQQEQHRCIGNGNGSKSDRSNNNRNCNKVGWEAWVGGRAWREDGRGKQTLRGRAGMMGRRVGHTPDYSYEVSFLCPLYKCPLLRGSERQRAHRRQAGALGKQTCNKAFRRPCASCLHACPHAEQHPADVARVYGKGSRSPT